MYKFHDPCGECPFNMVHRIYSCLPGLGDTLRHLRLDITPICTFDHLLFRYVDCRCGLRSDPAFCDHPYYLCSIRQVLVRPGPSAGSQEDSDAYWKSHESCSNEVNGILPIIFIDLPPLPFLWYHSKSSWHPFYFLLTQLHIENDKIHVKLWGKEHAFQCISCICNWFTRSTFCRINFGDGHFCGHRRYRCSVNPIDSRASSRSRAIPVDPRTSSMNIDRVEHCIGTSNLT